VRLVESPATLIAKALEDAAGRRGIQMRRHETIYADARFGSFSEVTGCAHAASAERTAPPRTHAPPSRSSR
jgi:hypothetical protein